jgi:hypothetical protein
MRNLETSTKSLEGLHGTVDLPAGDSGQPSRTRNATAIGDVSPDAFHQLAKMDGFSRQWLVAPSDWLGIVRVNYGARLLWSSRSGLQCLARVMGPLMSRRSGIESVASNYATGNYAVNLSNPT